MNDSEGKGSADPHVSSAQAYGIENPQRLPDMACRRCGSPTEQQLGKGWLVVGYLCLDRACRAITPALGWTGAVE